VRTIVDSGVVRQRTSHAALAQDTSQAAVPLSSSWAARVDAIIVPATRGPAHLEPAMALAALQEAILVVLCSQHTRADDVVLRAARVPGCRALIVDIPGDYQHDSLPVLTASEMFREANAQRSNDLSLKRNLGLLLARLHGWSKVLFLDDDIGQTLADAHVGIGTGVDLRTVRRLAAQLDTHQVAGLVCRDFPDNSVVCHARRLAGLPQDNFISGAALGVNCNDQPLPFFPDIYNEDWFFFSSHAASRELAQVGEAKQDPYDPYDRPDRALHEEFGDLLAGGLFALFEGQAPEMSFAKRVRGAKEPYWEHFIAARATSLDEVGERLTKWNRVPRLGRKARTSAETRAAATRSLTVSQEQLARLSPDTCVSFLHAWQDDLDDWQRITTRISGVGDSFEAMDHLGLTQWTSIGMTDRVRLASASVRGGPSSSGTR
jgi:hypothetical protein